MKADRRCRSRSLPGLTRSQFDGPDHDRTALVNLVENLNEVKDDIELLVGTLTPSLQEEVQAAVPAATTFVSGLEWLHGENTTEDDTAIGRLLLVDRGSILVSSIMPESKAEQAIFGERFGNGLVVIARRLMAAGLVPVRDPGP